MRHLLSEVRFRNFLHFSENHGRNFFSREHFVRAINLHHNVWFAILVLQTEWEEFFVVLNSLLTPCSADQPLGIEDSVLWIARKLILRGVANEALILLGESNI